MAQRVRSLDLTAHTSLSPIWRGFVPSFVNYKKGCTRLAVASDKVDQLLAQSRWFSPGTPASSTTKTGCHDIAESAVKTSKIKSNHQISSKAQTHKGIYSPVELRVIYIMLNVEDDHECKIKNRVSDRIIFLCNSALRRNFSEC